MDLRRALKIFGGCKKIWENRYKENINRIRKQNT